MTAFQKYQLEKERERNRVTEPAPHVSKYHQRYLDEVAARWGITELQLEGQEEKPKARTLADDIRLRDVEQARGEKLFAIAGEGLNRTPQRFWVSVRL